MEQIEVARLAYPEAGLLPVGYIDIPNMQFMYLPSYLENEHAIELSCSLPLREKPFEEHEFQPYFMGLVPEGLAREALAEELGISSSDYLAMLAACGRECIGDIVAWDPSTGPIIATDEGYEPIDGSTLRSIFKGMPEMAEENIGSRLSLAGSQGKIGLLRADMLDTADAPHWLRPRGLSASTHILKAGSLRDLAENEFLCMSAARACGISTAPVSLCSYGRPVVAVKRFDRLTEIQAQKHVVSRIHQEDLAQAFGLLSSDKYRELPGGTLHRIAELIRAVSPRPLEDLRQLCRIICFDYLIGNCDNHLKNLSLVWGLDTDGPRLSPAYDIVSTTAFGRFSRDMSISLGGVRDIDAIGAEELLEGASDMGISSQILREVCEPLAEQVTEKLIEASYQIEPESESAPFVAEDIVNELEPRLKVVRHLCR